LFNPWETDNASSRFTAFPGDRFGLPPGKYTVDGLQQPVIANQHSANFGIGTGANAGADQLQEVILRASQHRRPVVTGPSISGAGHQLTGLTVVYAVWAETPPRRHTAFVRMVSNMPDESQYPRDWWREPWHGG